MISSAAQLKSLIKMKSHENSFNSQLLLRNYMMERFLERISLSSYRNNFILKGSMLVSSIIGFNTRSTMDIDTTIQNLQLSVETATSIIQNIISCQIDDHISFIITNVENIIQEFDYPGLRFTIEGTIDNLKQAFKIDISTGDVITPSAIDYSYHLYFEDRYISICSYNIETLLSEKLETIISRANLNTRMRDFYDIHVLWCQKNSEISLDKLRLAFKATFQARRTDYSPTTINNILSLLRDDRPTINNWNRFVHTSPYANNISWDTILDSISNLFNIILI